MNSSSTDRIRVGLLGAGHISEFHVKALRRLPSVEIIGAADIDEEQVRDFVERHDLPKAFTSLEQLLDEQPDVVHVLTPPSAHAENATLALSHGCHVFVEKPLATSVEDCDRIAAAAKAAGRQVCVGHSLLRDPFVARAVKLVRQGAIGDVVSVDHIRSQFYPHFQGGAMPEQFRDGGFPFRDIGVHSIYLLQALLGEVRDATLKLGSADNDGYPRHKEWRVLAECERGLGQIYLSWNVSPLQNVLIVHGTRGVIRADVFGMSVTLRKSGRLPGHAERIWNSMNEGRGMITQVVGNVCRVLTKRLRQYHGLQEIVREFYQSLANGEAPPVDVIQGRSAVKWTEYIAAKGDEAKSRYVAGFATQGQAKVLVTGATGFIGQHLVRRLLAEGHRVRILVRRSPDPEFLNSGRVETFLGDLGDPEAVDRAMAGIEEVYHLGATVHGHLEDFQCGTIAGTENVIESCIRHNVPKLIYMSSLSVLHTAAVRKHSRIDEDWPLEPHPEKRGAYTQTKSAAERLVLEAARTRGLRAILLRPGEVMGPDRPFWSGAVGLKAGGRLVVLGSGKAVVPLVWVEDLVDAITMAAESDLFDGSVFNIVDPEEVTQDELAEHYLRTVRERKRIIHLPLTFLYPAAAGLQIGMRMLGRDAPITPYRLRSAVGNRRFDQTAISGSLGWEPRIGIRQGMQLVVEGEQSSSELLPDGNEQAASDATSTNVAPSAVPLPVADSLWPAGATNATTTEETPT